jgi:ribose transport system permease protein
MEKAFDLLPWTIVITAVVVVALWIVLERTSLR